MTKEERLEMVPVWEKATLTIEEAIAYTGIGRDKLYEISDSPDCKFVLWIGKRRMFKKKRLDEYIDNAYSI